MMTRQKSKYFISIALLLLAAPLLAQLGSGYGFYRDVMPVNEQSYFRIPLDAQTLAKSRSDFNDIRVLKVDENDSIENPYLLSWNESYSSNIWNNENIINVSFRKKEASYITIAVKDQRLINEIRLDIEEGDFDKRVTIEGSNDNQHWQTIREDARIVGFSAQLFKFATVYFPESSFNYYLISFNDKTSEPITVKAAQTSMNNEYSAVYKKINDVYVVRKEIKKDEKPVMGRKRNFDNYTQIKVALPYKACLHSIHLKNRDSKEDFYRVVAVTDTKGNTVFSGTFTSLDKDGTTIIQLDRFVTDSLIVKVINNDNQPLQSIDVSVFGMNAFLLTKLSPDEKYVVLYGKKNVAAPDYDLAYFSAKIRDSAKDADCKPEVIIKQQQVKPKDPFVKQQKWLWITLVGLVVLLGLFAFSMMKKVDKRE